MDTKKKYLTSAIIAFMAAMFIAFGLMFASAKTTANADSYLTEDDIQVAIAVREVDEEHENGGIRFKVRVEKEKFEPLMTNGEFNKGVSTGVLVTSNAIAKTLEGGLVKANASVDGVHDLDTTKYWKEITVNEVDYYESVVAIYNVPAEKSNVKLAVMPYVVNGKTTIYRNTAGVASMADAVLADDENGAAFAETYIHNYTVTYKDKDGNAIEGGSETVTYGNTIAGPKVSAPEITGYTFIGWGNKAGTATWVFGTTKVTGATNLYAKYEINTYTITFDMDGGALSDGENDDITSLTAHYGDSVNLLDALAKTKTGYTFVKWQYYDGEEYVDVPQNATVSGDITLKAVWTINLYTVSIAVAQDGYGTVSAATVANVPYNTAVSVSGNVLTVGETSITATASDATQQYTYAFDGWTNVPANVTEEVTISANFTRTLNQYTITFKNGDTTLQSGLVNYGETPVYSGNNPTKASDEYYDYTFAGWNEEIVSVEDDATYTAKFNQSILAENRDTAYTLTELGGTEGTAGMGQYGAGQTLTLKDSMEGEIVFKMTKTNYTGNQIMSFTLFYDGATATNGVLFYFEINANVVRINDKTITMGNVVPNVCYYYLIGYKVENDYSKISVRLRIETEDPTEVAAGRGVLGDGTVELTSLTGTDDVAAYVNANNRFLILPQQCWFEVADAWKSTDDYASQFVTLKTVYSGDETIDEINDAVQTLDDISLKCFAQVDKTAAAMNRSKELLQQGYFGVYTNEDLGLAAGDVAQWTSSIGDMPNKTSGSIIFNFTVGLVTNDAQRYIWINLFEEQVYNAGAGVYYPFEERGLINDDADLLGKVTAGTTYTVMISYKVASDHSSVVVNYRLVDASTGALVYTLTKTFTSVVRSDTSLADWIASHNKFSVGSGAYSYRISTPWTWSASVCNVFNRLYERQEDLVAGETLTKAQTLLEDFDVVYRVAFRSNSFDTIEATGGLWTSQEGYMPNKTCGTIKINFILMEIANDDQRYIWINLFEEQVTSGLPFEGLGLINGDEELRGKATTGPAYTAVISYKVYKDADNTVVDVNYRLLSTADNNVVVNLTKTFTSVVRSEANLEDWIAGHNMFYFGAGAYSYSVASA